MLDDTGCLVWDVGRGLDEATAKLMSDRGEAISHDGDVTDHDGTAELVSDTGSEFGELAAGLDIRRTEA